MSGCASLFWSSLTSGSSGWPSRDLTIDWCSCPPCLFHVSNWLFLLLFHSFRVGSCEIFTALELPELFSRVLYEKSVMSINFIGFVLLFTKQQLAKSFPLIRLSNEPVQGLIYTSKGDSTTEVVLPFEKGDFLAVCPRLISGDISILSSLALFSFHWKISRHFFFIFRCPVFFRVPGHSALRVDLQDLLVKLRSSHALSPSPFLVFSLVYIVSTILVDIILCCSNFPCSFIFSLNPSWKVQRDMTVLLGIIRMFRKS